MNLCNKLNFQIKVLDYLQTNIHIYLYKSIS